MSQEIGTGRRKVGQGGVGVHVVFCDDKFLGRLLSRRPRRRKKKKQYDQWIVVSVTLTACLSFSSLLDLVQCLE